MIPWTLLLGENLFSNNEEIEDLAGWGQEGVEMGSSCLKLLGSRTGFREVLGEKVREEGPWAPEVVGSRGSPLHTPLPP